MGLYFRKSISVGPFRFNLSKSGVGVSVGMKGLRLGTGPRGNYIHLGRGGIYYRTTIPSLGSTQQNFSQPAVQIPDTHASLEKIECMDVSQIVNSSSRALLEELNEKRNRISLLPLVLLTFFLIAVPALLLNTPIWLMSIFFVLATIGFYMAYNRDLLVKTVVLFYELDSEIEEAFECLHDSGKKLAEADVVWFIESVGKVYNKKYHAGASSLVGRKLSSVRAKAPPFLRANVETVAIQMGQQTLYFFPDRVIIYDQDGVGAISYRDISITVGTTRFIEDSLVPNDALVVDKTWRYVNKSGAPDRRFKNNYQMPICLYEEISLTSHFGLNKLLQVSHCGIGQHIADAIAILAKKIPE